MSDPESKTAKPEWGWNGDVCAVWGEAIVIGGTRPEKEARALLFSAAPDILDALKDALAGWRYIRRHYGDLSGVGWDRVEYAASEAIAKAEGVTNVE